jgi:type I restriction enzyme S subunit
MFDSVSLDQLATFEMGQSPDSNFVVESDEGTPFLQGCAEFGAITPNSVVSCIRPKKICKPGDILISVRAPVGDLNKADREYCIGRGLAAIRFYDGIDARLGWHLLRYWVLGLRVVAQGSTFKAIGRTELANLQVADVPIPEHRRIAEILDTIDEAIQKTEALISKLKAMKQGLLHDLLIRGLDENGKLRDPKAHPEQFKDSLLGRIPKEWEPLRLLDLVSIPNGQVDPKQKPYCYWPLIAPDHIESDTGRLLCLETAIEQGAISGKYEFKPGDVLYSKIRPYLRKAVLADRQGLCSADMYPLQPGPSLVPRFLLDVILGEHFSRFAASVSERSGFPKINRKELGEYRLALAPTDEQLHIASVMDTHDARIRTEEQYRDKLKLQKKGLMHDLLTGKVRVKI